MKEKNMWSCYHIISDSLEKDEKDNHEIPNILNRTGFLFFFLSIFKFLFFNRIQKVMVVGIKERNEC